MICGGRPRAMRPNVRSMRRVVPVPRVQAASTTRPALDRRAITARPEWTAGRDTAAFGAGTLACMRMEARLPEWARWNVDPGLEPWTVGVEEEVMLLEPDGSPAWRSEDVLQALPAALSPHTRGETHGLALELATSPHASVADAIAELRGLRAGLAQTVRALGLCAAVAGTHPSVRAEEVEVSPGARYQYLHRSLRELARREPTFALHVHVAIPEPEL